MLDENIVRARSLFPRCSSIALPYLPADDAERSCGSIQLSLFAIPRG